ncbi:hypothetical protein H9L39_00500 [Fusarium oxysporum f. sp. albedinis]|nr:hypothetical protein H9L39_00500 [Fusarium oxysporum f. sp. albedinis]
MFMIKPVPPLVNRRHTGKAGQAKLGQVYNNLHICISPLGLLRKSLGKAGRFARGGRSIHWEGNNLSKLRYLTL